MILRNPIERAFSHYNFMCLRGPEKLTFEESLLKEKVRISKKSHFGHYLKRGEYFEQLQVYYDLDHKNIKILLYEDFQ